MEKTIDINLEKNKKLKIKVNYKAIELILEHVKLGAYIYELMEINTIDDLLQYLKISIVEGENFLNYERGYSETEDELTISHFRFSRALDNEHFSLVDAAPTIKAALVLQLDVVNEAQQRVKRAGDSLIDYELDLMKYSKHPLQHLDNGEKLSYDYEEVKFVQKVYPESFYKIVKAVALLDEINQVGAIGFSNFMLLKTLCEVKQIRASKNHLQTNKEPFVINTIELNLDTWKYIYRQPAWMEWINFYDEGCPCKDLKIEVWRGFRSSIYDVAEHIVRYKTSPKIVIAFKLGDVVHPDYEWFYHKDEFCIGVRKNLKTLINIVKAIFKSVSV